MEEKGRYDYTEEVEMEEKNKTEEKQKLSTHIHELP